MIIILLGAPGSGKGTQAEFLVKQYGFAHLSTGDLLRDEMAKSTELGKSIENMMSEGQLVPTEIVNNLVEQRLRSTEEGIVLDGYPRNVEQANFISEVMGSKLKDMKAIYFSVADDIIIKRITGRVSCISCKKIYNEHFSPIPLDGKCEGCGNSEFNKRSDDNEDSIKVRLSQYKEKTSPVIEFYKDQGLLYEVDAARDSQRIAEELRNFLKKD